jgi:hypothetical protein
MQEDHLKSEFEEKQFEGLANSELIALPSGQVAEYFLGYDAVAHPDIHHAVWKYLGSTPLPGVLLTPSHWHLSARGAPTANALPLSAASLILQYKRPEHMQRSTAGNWILWGVPYYRFKVDQGQHQVLEGLESSLAGKAFVRYAAPAFHTRKELNDHWRGRSVLVNTGFVEPSAITGHKYWTYTAPGIAGQPNPQSGSVAFETKDTLLALVGNAVTSGSNVAEHLADLRIGLTSAITDLTESQSTMAEYTVTLPEIDLAVEQAQILSDLKFVAEANLFLGLTWRLAVAEELEGQP